MAQKALLKLVAKLYEAKVKADEVDDREGNMRAPFPEFIQDFFINQYGLKSLADKQLGKLVTGVHKHSAAGAHYHSRAHTFARLVGILDPENYNSITVNFMMDTMRMFFITAMIDETLNQGDVAISVEQAEIALQTVFATYETELPADLIAKLVAVSTAVDIGEAEPMAELDFDAFFAIMLDSVRARPGRLSALSVP
jgi:hypothetical protein